MTPQHFLPAKAQMQATVNKASEWIKKPSPIFLLLSIFHFIPLVQREIILRTKEIILAFHYTVELDAFFFFN